MKRPQAIALAVLVVLLGLAHASLWRFPFEDSYITFRYARNLLDGHGLVYNPGESVEGFTSFGWIMLLVGTAWTGVALPVLARTFSWLAGAGILIVSAVMARRWAPDARWRWLVVPLLVGTQGTFAFYTASGMETTFFALLVLTAAFLLFGDRPRDSFLAGLTLAAATIVRPEGSGYFVVLAATLATHRPGRRLLPWMAGAFGAAFLPYFAWRWHHFGYPLPNTYYAKAPVGTAGLANGLRYVETFLSTYGFWLVPVAMFFVGKDRKWDGRWRVLSALLIGAFADSILVGGDTFAFHRFLLPAIPAGCIALTEGLALLVRRFSARGLSLRLAAGIQLGATLALAAWTMGSEFLPRYTLVGYQGKSLRSTIIDVARINSHYFLVGAWLRQTFPPDTLVATNAAGIVPYISRLPTLDMLGLNDVHIAHASVTGPLGAVGHQRHDASYVLERRPAIILLGLPVLSTEPLQPPDVRPWFAQWFPFLPGDEALVDDPRFGQRYRLVNAEIRSNAWLALFLRDDVTLPEPLPGPPRLPR